MGKRKSGAFLLILVLLATSLSVCGKEAKEKETETGNTGQEQTKPGGNAAAGTYGADTEPDGDAGKESTINFIVGTKPLEEYDRFAADLRSYGIEECIGYKQAALDRYNAR